MLDKPGTGKNWRRMGSRGFDLPELTSSELRLLPLLTTELTLDQIALVLDMPRDVVLALAQSIYAKLGPFGETQSRLRRV